MKDSKLFDSLASWDFSKFDEELVYSKESKLDFFKLVNRSHWLL